MPAHQEHLRGAGDVADWLGHARALPQEDALWLKAAVKANRGLAADLFDAALRLRENIHASGSALAEGRAPAQIVLDGLAALHARCLNKARLKLVEAGFAWSWQCRADPVEAALGPLALSAVAILFRSDLSRLKRCEGDACGWLFFDATKNKKRRWCEMEVCGNRAKQKRFNAKRATA